VARFERFGVLGTETDGNFFTESEIPGGANLGEVKVTSDRQNIPLDKLKASLAKQVKARGGNALVTFTYGQKASIWSFSSTRITARGVAVRIEEI
jgi:hypothetical protein